MAAFFHICRVRKWIADSPVLSIKLPLPLHPEDRNPCLRSGPARRCRCARRGAYRSPQYTFWSGEGDPKSAVADWQRSFRRLLKIADVKGHFQHAAGHRGTIRIRSSNHFRPGWLNNFRCVHVLERTVTTLVAFARLIGRVGAHRRSYRGDDRRLLRRDEITGAG
jgi:hypothetical protein